MEKLKKWIEPTKNKIIIGIIALLLVAGGGFAVWSLNQPKPIEPVVIFKENIVFEYGQGMSYEVFLDKIIDKEKSKFDSIIDMSDIDTSSVTIKSMSDEVDESGEQSYSISVDNQSEYGTEINNNILTVDKGNEKVTFNLKNLPSVKVVITKEGDVLEKTSNKPLDEVIYEKTNLRSDKRKATITVQLSDIEKSFDFEYDVHDTQAPIIEGAKDVETKFNEPLDFEELISASDPIDGEVEVIIVGDYDWDTAGKVQLKAIAKDKNGNTSDKSFILTILEEEKEEVETPSTTQPNISGGNTASSGGISSNGGSSSNGGGGTTTKPAEPKPTEPTKPVEPEKPSRPAPDAPSGMVYYKDYGSFDGCSAESRNVAKENVKTMANTLCDSYGYMYYTPYE